MRCSGLQCRLDVQARQVFVARHRERSVAAEAARNSLCMHANGQKRQQAQERHLGGGAQHLRHCILGQLQDCLRSKRKELHT